MYCLGNDKKGIKNMKDLKISYKNENDIVVKKEYDTIMDFIDEMESNSIDVPMLDYTNVTYTLFENKLNSGKFNTIADLLEHCKRIIR
jgi:hypothetical protein